MNTLQIILALPYRLAYVVWFIGSMWFWSLGEE